MAVASPVLERSSVTRQKNEYDFMSVREADELHNAQIKERYARLINPEMGINDMAAQQTEEIAAAAALKNEANAAFMQAAPVQETPVQEVKAPAAERSVYLVENARADADIFRADSEINKRREELPVLEAQQSVEEEENDDLRPTLTTIQYQTTGIKKTEEEGLEINSNAEKRFSLSKRDKIIIAVVVTVIVALFALIIVNSAIISGLNSDLSSLQTSLSEARDAAHNVNVAVSEQRSVLEQTAKEVAQSLGLLG